MSDRLFFAWVGAAAGIVLAFSFEPEPREPVCFKGYMVQIVDNKPVPLEENGKYILCEIEEK
jgi:hypothetical protein